MDISKFLNEDFKAKLTKLQSVELPKIRTREAASNFIAANQSLFSSMQNSTDIEDLTNQFFDNIGSAKNLAFQKIFQGDLLSSKVDDTILKGKMIKENEESYTINHLSKGEIDVPKNETIKFFQGQKFDIRELNNVVSENYSHKFNINDIPKPDKLKLLMGKETSVLNITLKVNGEVSKEDQIRLKLNKKENKVYLNVIQAFKNKVYNKIIPEDILTKIKNGQEEVMKFKANSGKEFETIVYWDKEMNGLRTKPNKEENQSVKKDLNKDQRHNKKEGTAKSEKNKSSIKHKM